MRILFVSHTPLEDAAVEPTMAASMARLRLQGHDVRALVVDGVPNVTDVPNVRRIVCHADHPSAPIHFAAPSFDAGVAGAPSFDRLTDRQLSEYRDILRIEFDREIDLHDPHVVHTQQLWLFAHLALEAGVPYVASAVGVEFPLLDADVRYRRYLVEATENAGRVLAHTDEAHRIVSQLAGDLNERLMHVPAGVTGAVEPSRTRLLETVYRDTFFERFGREPE